MYIAVRLRKRGTRHAERGVVDIRVNLNTRCTHVFYGIFMRIHRNRLEDSTAWMRADNRVWGVHGGMCSIKQRFGSNTGLTIVW